MLLKYTNYSTNFEDKSMIKKLLLIVIISFVGYGLTDAQHKVISFSEIISEYNNGKVSANEAYNKMIIELEKPQIKKCLTPVYMFADKHKNELVNATAHLKNRSKRKASVATYTSPSGKFELNYEVTGDNAVPTADGNNNGVPDYVEWTAKAADSSYSHLVGTLGFSDPIPDGSVYEVFFENLDGTYGVTYTYNNPSGPGTKIVMENDFLGGFPDNNDPDGNQRGAIRATMAHEFKHAIQYQQNGFSGDSDAWAEMDATLIEEVVYDQVNDYYNYLGGSNDVFGAPGLTVIPGSYEDATWAIYFHEKYGQSFWPETWARIENNELLSFLNAIKQELEDRGLNYTQALQELYTWHFASGSFRADNFGFKEGLFYPTPTVQNNITQITDAYSNDISLARFAAHMTNVVPPSNQTGDVAVLMDTSDDDISLSVLAIFKDGTSSLEFADEESGKWVVNEGWKWQNISRLGVVVLNEKTNGSVTFKLRFSDTYPTSIPIDETIPTTTKLAQNYPNPFNPSTTIPVSISEFQKVKVDVYDITGRLVQSVFNGNLNAGNYELPVNMEKFSSGVYLYRLQTNDEVMIKRMTLVK